MAKIFKDPFIIVLIPIIIALLIFVLGCVHKVYRAELIQSKTIYEECLKAGNSDCEQEERLFKANLEIYKALFPPLNTNIVVVKPKK